VLDAPNFRIKDFPLADRLQRTFQIETLVENDVNLAALGEAWKGAAKGFRSVLGIMIGTGIGGGMLMDGRLYRGKNKTAGEIGHMVVDFDSDKECGCGQYGCFEALASRRSMARDIADRKRSQGLGDILWNETDLGSTEIAKYYKDGDSDVVAVVTQAAEICGKAVFSALNLLNPDIIVFNGGFVRQLGEVFMEPVRAEAAVCMRAVYSVGENSIPIKLGSLRYPVLVGACKVAVSSRDGAGGRRKEDIITAIVEGLDDHDWAILQEIYRYGRPAAISGHPSGEVHKDRLRKLRNRGLIQTIENLSLRKSESVSLTKLGTMVVEETA
jgi:predicted NBD/HSP70 family sugar kinase